MSALRATLLLESPAAFRSRNLFVSANALSPVVKRRSAPRPHGIVSQGTHPVPGLHSLPVQALFSQRSYRCRTPPGPSPSPGQSANVSHTTPSAAPGQVLAQPVFRAMYWQQSYPPQSLRPRHRNSSSSSPVQIDDCPGSATQLPLPFAVSQQQAGVLPPQRTAPQEAPATAGSQCASPEVPTAAQVRFDGHPAAGTQAIASLQRSLEHMCMCGPVPPQSCPAQQCSPWAQSPSSSQSSTESSELPPRAKSSRAARATH